MPRGGLQIHGEKQRSPQSHPLKTEVQTLLATASWYRSLHSSLEWNNAFTPRRDRTK